MEKNLPLVAIIHFSATGRTAALAAAIRAGAGTLAEIRNCAIEGQDILEGRYINPAVLEVVDSADAVAFGAPTYLGGPATQFKAFADATSSRWEAQRWAGKLAAGFTTGACANGDQGQTLAWLSVLAAQHGMLWCGLDIPGGLDPEGRNRHGTQLGVTSSGVEAAGLAADLATAHHLGLRLARLAAALPKPAGAAPRSA